jgi:hypothetical protein
MKVMSGGSVALKSSSDSSNSVPIILDNELNH